MNYERNTKYFLLSQLLLSYHSQLQIKDSLIENKDNLEIYGITLVQLHEQRVLKDISVKDLHNLNNDHSIA